MTVVVEPLPVSLAVRRFHKTGKTRQLHLIHDSTGLARS
jgi:hypothetical protein